MLDSMLVSNDATQLHLTPNPPVDFQRAMENLSDLQAKLYQLNIAAAQQQSRQQRNHATNAANEPTNLATTEQTKSEVLREAQRFAAAAKMFIKCAIDCCYHANERNCRSVTNVTSPTQEDGSPQQDTAPSPRPLPDDLSRSLGRAVVMARRLSDAIKKLINQLDHELQGEHFKSRLLDIVGAFIDTIAVSQASLARCNAAALKSPDSTPQPTVSTQTLMKTAAKLAAALTALIHSTRDVAL